jgi:AraC-like DNA-binding protein
MLGLLSRISDWREHQLKGMYSSLIADAIDYVEEHYAEDIDFHSLMKRAGMSATHFRRQFKQITGDAPQTYQKRLRVRLAKELLRHTNHSVSEIAQRVGYPEAAYFTRVFTKRVGVSPSVWRSTGV